ncbi:MAG TPA: septum site-determining protein MinC [Firmicutes bacterium]|nr:septum site-determining protein MinC [Bacillota bacterium]
MITFDQDPYKPSNAFGTAPEPEEEAPEVALTQTGNRMEDIIEEADLANEAAQQAEQEEGDAMPLPPFSKEHMAYFYKGNLRSGMSLEYDGTIVILGDVNPGAQVKATGNIIVLGALKGVAHAGSSGEPEAYVFALNMNPVQLRIGDLITRFPDGERSKSLKNPEYAYAEDGVVYVSAFE